MSEISTEFINEFFEIRFGKEHSKTDGYYQEWVIRFENGVHEMCMDSESKRIYYFLLEKYNIL